MKTLLFISILFLHPIPPVDDYATNPRHSMAQDQGEAPDDNTPYHEGTASHCDNDRQTDVPHQCDCERARQKCNGLPGDKPANIYMSRTCKTSCHPDKCGCYGHGCTS